MQYEDICGGPGHCPGFKKILITKDTWLRNPVGRNDRAPSFLMGWEGGRQRRGKSYGYVSNLWVTDGVLYQDGDYGDSEWQLWGHHL